MIVNIPPEESELSIGTLCSMHAYFTNLPKKSQTIKEIVTKLEKSILERLNQAKPNRTAPLPN